MALLEFNAILFYTFFIGLLMVLAYCSRWRRYFQLGMKLPGPPGLPIIKKCLQFTSNDLSNSFQKRIETARSYGPIVRSWFGPVLVVKLTDPDNIETVVKHDKIGSRGYLVRKLLEQAFRNGLLCLDGEDWRRHRKIVSAALQINVLETFVEIFAKNSDILANKWKALADGITAHDVAPYLTRCSLDIIYQTCSRININVQTGNDESTLNNFTFIIKMIRLRFLKPWLLIDWIFNASELGKKYNRAVQCEHGKMMNEMAKKKWMRETAETRGLNDEKPSLMDHLIQYADISKEEIVGEIATIIGAGTETTANACGYVLALLADNQHIQAKVMQEQQDIFSDDILRPVGSDDLPRMVYLEQVLKEAMRLFPPAPVHYREAMKEIDLGHGHIIPEGTNISMSAYIIHRDPRYFPDPEKFDPERFSPQNSVGRHPYAYTPFGIGRRMCVGHVFATMEAKTILSTVLRRYRVTELEGGVKGLEDTLKLSLVMSPANGIRVKLLPRSHPGGGGGDMRGK